MSVDWWSLVYETRVEAWKNVATILKIIWNELLGMLTGNDPVQVVLAVILIIGMTVASGRALLRIFWRLVRNNAFNA